MTLSTLSRILTFAAVFSRSEADEDISYSDGMLWFYGPAEHGPDGRALRKLGASYQKLQDCWTVSL